jgi:uncharacterized membrane protein
MKEMPAAHSVVPPEPLLPPNAGAWERLAHLRATTRLGAALLVSILTTVLWPSAAAWPVRAVAAWDSFAVVALSLTWLTILTLPPVQIKKMARREDPGRVVTLALVVIGAGVALLAVLQLLQVSHSMDHSDRIGAILLAISAVIGAWTLTHTVFTLRYAHKFYEEPGKPPGLNFPDVHAPDGLAEPDYLDFAYYAFTIGMAAQTADVAVRARDLRRLTLLHATISFAFNTAVIALSVGALGGLF